MSADCRKVVVTIEIPACDPCAGTGPGDGPGGGRPPQPIPTPFLVIPCVPGDTGTRPVPAAQALYNPAIGWTIANPTAPGGWNDFQVQLSCAVDNLGTVASPAAMIEFYTGAPPGSGTPATRPLPPTRSSPASSWSAGPVSPPRRARSRP